MDDVLKVLVTPAPVTLASFAVTQGPIGMVTSKVYEGLLSYDAALEPVGCLSTSWDVDATFSVFRFSLAEGVTFHDGSPFTSWDVKFTFEDVLRHLHPRGRFTLKDLSGVDTPSAHTAVFRFSRPVPHFLRTLSAIESPILSHRLGGAGTLDAYRAREHPVGTGPYVFDQWDTSGQITLRRNEGYRRQACRGVERLCLDAGASDELSLAGITDGTLDAAGMGGAPWDAADFVRDRTGVCVADWGARVFNPVLRLDFNTKRPALTDTSIRRWLSGMIDRDALLKQAFCGAGSILDGTSMPRSWVDQGLVSQAEPSVPTSASPVPPASAWSGSDLILDVIPYGPAWRTAAQKIVDMFGRNGVSVAVREESFSRWLKRIFTDQDFDMTLNYVYMHMDPALSMTRFHHTSGIVKGATFSNASAWSTPEMDRLIDAALTCIDPVSRADLYGDLDRRLLEATPSAWLAEIHPPTVVSDRAQPFFDAPFGLYGAGITTVT